MSVLITSTIQTVTLTNSQSTALSISSVAIAGTNSGDFAQTDNCPLSPSTLAAHGTCTINVTFTPTATGTRSATLTVTDNAAGSPQTVSLIGTGGAAAAVSLAPTALTFASQTVGATSTAQTSTLTNSGGTALTVTSIVASGDFAQTNDCGSSVAAGGRCTISVTFTPTATGTRTGTVTIADSAAGSPHILPLMGTGTAPTLPTISVSPTTLAFARTRVGSTSAPQTVTVTNTSGVAATISGMAVAGPYATAGSTCGSTLAARISCAVSVTFTPIASGTQTGTLTITDNALDSPQVVSLSGRGR